MKSFDGRRILITGGTGSLGKVLIRRLLSGEMGLPAKLIVFSRDEAKQHFMRVEYQNDSPAPTDEIIYHNFERLLEFRPHEKCNTIRAILVHQLLSERRFFAQFVGTAEPAVEQELKL